VSSVKRSAPDLFTNFDSLTDHGSCGLRADALHVAAAGIGAVDPAAGTLESISFDGKQIRAGDRTIDLAPKGKIYVIGSGKASYPIAATLEEIFGERIIAGVLVVKKGEKRRLERIEVLEAAHPLPDATSVAGAERLLEMARIAVDGDIVFTAITGGASSLTTLPPPGIEIEAISRVSDLLLKSGATIREINTVRRHLCLIKGGRLVAAVQPATAITVTLDTAPKGMPWPDMCLPDSSTFTDAVTVLQQYRLWDIIPAPVREYLNRNRSRCEEETVKSFDGMSAFLVSVGDPFSACRAAAEEAQRLGYSPMILSSTIGGEARELGVLLAGIAEEIHQRGIPIAPPCALISGGETIVTIDGTCGKGGPNQETVLGFANAYDGAGEAAILAVDTDGTDGPTDIAGGIADSFSTRRFRERNICLGTILRDHNTLKALTAVGDAVLTGHTGTNVMNLRVLVLR
jgi:glycerate 2-kinase